MQEAGTDASGKWMCIDHCEKFAKSIIEECIDIIRVRHYPEKEYEDIEKNTIYSQGWIGGRVSAVIAIKKHFGID